MSYQIVHPMHPAGQSRARLRALLAVMAGLLALSGCAGPATVQPPALSEQNKPLAACEHFYGRLDAAAQSAGVADARAQRLKGAPYLRTSRFLASFDPAQMQPDGYQRWLQRLNILANQGLTNEWRRLPDSMQNTLRDAQWPDDTLIRDNTGALDGTQNLDDRGRLEASLAQCGQRLVRHLAHKAPRLSAIEARDHYQSWKRWVGLYPAVMLPFRWGVVREHDEIARQQARHRQALADGSLQGEWEFYKATGMAPGTPSEALQTLADSPRDALGIPELTSDDRERLLGAFMPALAIEAGPHGLADNDRPVQLRADSEGRIHRDPEVPSLYTHITHGRYRDQVTVQLNYSVWFSERRPETAVDLLAGQYDGVTWRVHLAATGDILGYDKVHQCGCWYQFFPVPGPAPEPELPFTQEPFYIGAPVPPAQNHTLWLAANTHQLLGVSIQQPERDPQPLTVRPYEQLRALEDGEGGYHSPFNSQGLIPESRRPERYLFWPMGIASPGASRIHGTHAIAFIGRRHFDDPRLLEELGL